MNNKDIIDTVEASRILGISRQWIGRLLKQGVLKGIKVGRYWALNRAEVEAYREQQRGYGDSIDTSHVDDSTVD